MTGIEAGTVRVATFRAAPGRLAELVEAARANARVARVAVGCLSADVCRVPDQPDSVVVVSRWRTPADLDAFLEWHETLAHSSVADSSAAKPQAVRYPSVPVGPE